jgi:hypothetical protein
MDLRIDGSFTQAWERPPEGAADSLAARVVGLGTVLREVLLNRFTSP